MNDTVPHNEELAHTNLLPSRRESDELSDCSSEQDSRLSGTIENSETANSDQILENEGSRPEPEKNIDGDNEKKVRTFSTYTAF